MRVVLNTLHDWVDLKKGAFSIDASGPRKVEFELNVSSPTVVSAIIHKKSVLVGAFPPGVHSVQCQISGKTKFDIATDGHVFGRFVARDQMIVPEDRESLTDFDYRRRENSDYERLMLVMQRNEHERQRQFEENERARNVRLEAELRAASLSAKRDTEPRDGVDAAPEEAAQANPDDVSRGQEQPS